jgi:hypothetical protein
MYAAPFSPGQRPTAIAHLDRAEFARKAEQADQQAALHTCGLP